MPASLPQLCPDEDTLLAFAEGQLAGDSLDRVVLHLEGCDRCLGAVGAMGRTPGSGPVPAAEGVSGTTLGARGGSASTRGRSHTAFRPDDLVAGRYEIRRFVARGGMGEVYEAHDRLVGTRVALKTVLLASADDPRAVELMRREVRIARAITHPGICRVFDLGQHEFTDAEGEGGKLLFLTMEFLDGTTLGDQIRASGPLPFGTLMPVARQLAEALAAAHGAGIVHRDLKSDNVMWLSSGAPDSAPRVVVMDFGLARPAPGMSGVHSTGGMVVGSVGYMAPEQVEGTPVSAAADVYAFGVVLFEAVTARLPFVAGTPMATALKRLREPPPTPSSVARNVHPGIEAIIMRCLERRPIDRFASMREVAAALDAIDRTVAIPRARRRGRGVIWGMGGVAAAAAMAAGWFLLGAGPERAESARSGALPAADVARVPSLAGGGAPAVAPAPSTSAAAAAVDAHRPEADGVARASAASVTTTTPPAQLPANETRRSPRRARAVPTPQATPARDAPPVSGPAPEAGGRSRSTLDGFADPYR